AAGGAAGASRGPGPGGGRPLALAGGPAVGAPVEEEVRRRAVGGGGGALPTGRAEHGRRDEDAGACAQVGGTVELPPLDGGEALVGRRRLELARGPHLRGRREQALLAAPALAQLLGRGQGAEAVEQAGDEVELRLGERRVEPDAPSREAMAVRRLDHVAARGARQIRVVEHDEAGARGEVVIEGVSDAEQRSAALVAVDANV